MALEQTFQENLDDGIISTAPPREPVAEAVVPPEPEPAPAPAPVEPETPVAIEPVAETPEEPAPEPKAAPLPDWMKRRLGEETGKRHEAQRKAEEAERRLAVLEATIEELRRGAVPAEEAPPQLRPAASNQDLVPRSEIEARAAQLQREHIQKEAMRAHNDAIDKAVETASKNYKDFGQALQTLQAVGIAGRMDFQETLLATEAAPDLIYYLGNNPEQADQIKDLLDQGKQVQAATRMTRIADGLKTRAPAIKKASEAPAPIKPVGGSATPVTELDKMGMDDFSREMDKIAANRRWW